MTWSPPVVPPRRPGWEHAYAEITEQFGRTPFSWGTADCLTRVADLTEAMTGVNPLPYMMRRYRSAAGAEMVLQELGFATPADALAAVFPSVPVSMARRGDCGIGSVRVAGEVHDAAFIVLGVNALGAGEKGAVVVPTLMLKQTFAIGWSPT